MKHNIDTLIRGSFRTHLVQEFLTNSFHFPLVNILIEMLLETPLNYFREPDLYAMVAASLVQTFVLGRRSYMGRPMPLPGNLIGPALYSVIDIAIEGPVRFFASPFHIGYWVFSLLIGLAQEMRLRFPGGTAKAVMLAEHFVRTNIILFGYWVFEVASEPKYAPVAVFLSDSSHVFLVLLIPLLGLLIGFANITAQSYMTILRQTADKLKIYSEWFLGRDLLSKAVAEPAALTLQRQERTVLFMDIRRFTDWSEPQPPEEVVSMLNAYYEESERIWSKTAVIKTKISADEVMLVFEAEQDAVNTALELRKEVGALMSHHGLSVGIGVNSGPLVEGLLGSRDIKSFDVIGDTVNTAKRICDAAKGGEILISSTLHADEFAGQVKVLETRSIQMKGKAEPLSVSVI